MTDNKQYPKLPIKKEWNQVTGRDGKMYVDGWNACIDAMRAAQEGCRLEALEREHLGDWEKKTGIYAPAVAQAAPAAVAGFTPDYSEMSREALERHASRMAQMLADDKPRAFWERYATGPMSAPSCLCCGQLPEEVAIRHGDLPSIVICKRCRNAAQAPAVAGPSERTELASRIKKCAEHWAHMERIDHGDQARAEQSRHAEMVDRLVAVAGPSVRDEILRLAQFADQAARMSPRDMHNNMERLAQELTHLLEAPITQPAPQPAVSQGEAENREMFEQMFRVIYPKASSAGALELGKDGFYLELETRLAFRMWNAALATLPQEAAPSQDAAQADVLTPADADQLEKAIADFDECGETDVPDAALQRFAAMGYLECVRYNVLPAAHAAIDAARKQEGK